VFFHHKAFLLEIKTIGDLLMVWRKQAGFTLKQARRKNQYPAPLDSAS
jgi:hypothetical protein